MPIRHYLQGHRFDPETARLLGVAFEMALVTLQHADGPVAPTRDAVAQKIIELAKAGERDPERTLPIKIAVIETAKKPRTCMVIYLFNLLGSVDLIDLQLGLIEFAGTAAHQFAVRRAVELR